MNWTKGYLSLILAVLLTMQTCLLASFADEASGQSLNLDLGSTNQNISASVLFGSGGSNPVTITSQSGSTTVDSNSMLTAAQFIATQQVLSTGSQSIVLGAAGQAIGGTANFNNSFNSAISNLVVPTGVTFVQDFSSGSILNLTGNLVNSGNLYGVASAGSSVNNALFQAMNIQNNIGAIFSTALPSSGLAGYSNLTSGLNLSLVAINNIINSGTISSAGNLNLTAGNSIINALPQGILGTSPVMQAMNNLNLQAASIINQGAMISQLANINAITASLNNNLGTISAVNGNVNIQNLLGNTLAVNNVLGSIQAKDGILFETLASIRDANGLITTKSTVDLLGGELSASKINFNSPDGFTTINTDSLNGQVNINSGDLQLRVETGDLNMGTVALSGDPVIEVPAGSIAITDFITFTTGVYNSAGTDVMFLAGGSVTAGTAIAGDTIIATNALGTGGKIYIAAGATWNAASPDKTITGASGLGGDISLTGINLQTNIPAITATPAVRLNAFNGAGGNGNISIGNIDASGQGSQQGGTISITATGTITTGNIISNGGAIDGSAGTATITSSTANSVTTGLFSLSGVGNGAGGTVTVNSANLQVGGSVTMRGVGNGNWGGNFNVVGAGGTKNFTASIDLTASGNGSGGAFDISANGAAGAITIQTILGLGGGDGDGSNISIAANQSTITVNGDLTLTGSGFGHGGSVSITGGSSIVMQNIFSVGGLNAAGGSVGIDASSGSLSIQSVNNSAGADGAVGGEMNGGGIFLSAAGDLTAVNLISRAGLVRGNGGDIGINTNNNLVGNGDVNITGFIDNSALGIGNLPSEGGMPAVSIGSFRHINVTSINGLGGNTQGDASPIFLQAGFSGIGNIFASSFLDSSARNTGNAGQIQMSAPGNIEFGSARANGPDVGGGNAGGIDINAGGFVRSVNTGGDNFISSSADTPITGDNTGNAAPITITSGQGVLAGVGANVFSVRAEGGTHGGNGADITITSDQDINLSFVDSSASPTMTAADGAGNAGIVQITSNNGVISVLDIRAEGGFFGGNGANITVLANGSGGMYTSTLFTSAAAYVNGTGGNIDIQADSTISAGDVYTWGRGGFNAGTVNITSANGSVTTGLIDTTATGGATGNSGDVTINSALAISTNYIAMYGDFAGGNLIVNSTGGGFTTNNNYVSTSASINGQSGSINVNVAGDIGTSFIDSTSSGNNSSNVVSLITSNGQIQILRIDANAGQNGNGGAITLQATSNINITGTDSWINSLGGTTTGNGGAINITTSGGTVQVGNFIAANGRAAGNGGAILVSANTGVSIDSIESLGGLTSGNGGLIGVSTTNGNILFAGVGVTGDGGVSSRAQGGGAGGNITLTASNGNVAVRSFSGLTGYAINSEGIGVGNSGDISINYNVAGAGTFVIDNANAAITNGARGPINAGTPGNGNSGTLTINNLGAAGSNNVTIELNDTINLDSIGGVDSILNLSEPGGNIVINGNADGLIVGSLTAGADSVSITMARDNLTLTTNNISGTNGSVIINLTGLNAILNMTDALSITSSIGSNISISSPNIYFGTGSNINSGADVIISTNNIRVNDGTNGTISGTSGNIAISAPFIQNLSFTKTAGAGSATLNLNGIPTLLTVDNGTLTIDANVDVLSNNNITANLTTAPVVNNGNLRSSSGTGTITLNALAGDLNVSGTGLLQAANGIALNSTTAAVIVNQPTITGAVSGTAGTSYSVTATGAGGLTAGNTITANNGAVTLLASGGLLTVNPGASISATLNVNMTGQTGVVIGTGAGAAVSVQAGRLAGGFNAFSTNINDYNTTAFTSSGAVLVTSNTGNININDNVTLLSLGNSVGLTSANDITFGNNNNLFAQGANVWMYAANRIIANNGSQFQSVARYLPAGTVVIDGTNVQNFQGGGIAIYAGGAPQNYDTLLRNLQLARVSAGTVNISGGVSTVGTTFNSTNGSTYELIAPGAGKVSLENSTVNIDGAVLSIDPPGDTIFLSSMVLTIVGPPLTGTPVPPPPTPTPSTSTTLTSSATVTSPVATTVENEAATIPNPIALTTDLTSDRFESPVIPMAINQEVQIINNTVASDTNTFVVAAGDCQPFELTQDNDNNPVNESRTAIVGEGGTEFAPNGSGNVVLKQGKMVLLTGNRDMTVATNQGDVVIPANSSSIVEQRNSGLVRISALTGTPAKFTLKGSADEILAANPGEELVVGDSSLSDEELIAADGVDREIVVGGSISIAHTKITKVKFNVDMLANREPLLQCNMGNFYGLNRRFNNLRRDMIGVGSNSGPNTNINPTSNKTSFNPQNTNSGVLKNISAHNQETAQSELKPIAYINASIGPAAKSVSSFESGHFVIKHGKHTNVNVDENGVINLTKGSIVVRALDPSLVKAGRYTVSVDPGAIALVEVDGSIVKIANLYEGKLHSVKAYVKRGSVPIASGQEAIFGIGEGQIGTWLKNNPVARRRMKNVSLKGGHKLTRSEVSLVSMIQNSPLLFEVWKSEHHSDKDISDKVLKMAACLLQVTTSHGPYSSTGNNMH